MQKKREEETVMSAKDKVISGSWNMSNDSYKY